jgi:hypothetical protein
VLLLVHLAGVYEQLLARRGPLLEDAVPGAGVVLGGSGDGVTRKVLRLRLLSSLAAHCRLVVREELAPGLGGQVGGCQCTHTAVGGLCMHMLYNVCLCMLLDTFRAQLFASSMVLVTSDYQAIVSLCQNDQFASTGGC